VTTPTTPTTPETPTGSSTVAQLGAVLVGMSLVGIGAYFLRAEMTTPPTHSGHVYLFSGFIGFGALLIVPGPFARAIKTIAPYLPKIGNSAGNAP